MSTGIPQTVPMPNPAPVRLPPWPNIRPGLIGSFPTQAAFGSLPYMDTIATAVSVSQERSQGEGVYLENNHIDKNQSGF